MIDARGFLCPLPVLRLRKALLERPEGTILRLIATDRMTVVDVPHFCSQGGHVMVSLRDLDDGVLEFTVKKGAPASPASGGLTPDEV